jgi:predicted regulator of Ras-like GTPase activity (Roadblock/LC7/MglB family)
VLDDTLAGLLEVVGGARAAIVMGTDGMIVASAGEPLGAGLDVVAACWADLDRRTRLASSESGLGEPAELITSSDAGSVVLRRVTPDYGILLLLAPGGSLGRARFELRKAASRIRPELES